MTETPRCQDWIRNRELERVRCQARAHWIALAPDGSPHHLVCKPHGVLYTGIDLRPVEYVTLIAQALNAEPHWPARYEPSWTPRPALPPSVRRCLVCALDIATPYWCAGCNYWVYRQSPFGKRVLFGLARRTHGELTLAQLRAAPERVRAVRGLGPKAVAWLLEVELPVREAVG